MAAKPDFRTDDVWLQRWLDSLDDADTVGIPTIALNHSKRALLVNALGEWQKAQARRGMHTRISPALRFSQQHITNLITDLLTEDAR